MKCDKIRFHLPAYAAGESGEAPAIRAHLDGCPDCRTRLVKTTRLRSLLALKRHEQPDEFFFRTYLTGFHRRLISDMSRRSTIRSAVQGAFARWQWASILPRLAYGGIFAVFALTLYLTHIPLEKTAAPVAAHAIDSKAPTVVAAATPPVVEMDSAFNRLVLAQNHSAKSSVYVLDRVAYKPSNHGADVLEF